MASYEDAITALADPTRRRVFEQLRGRPRAVGELARLVPVSRPAVSQHLRVLKEAGLVHDRAEGTRRIYSVSGEGLAELRAYVNGFWDEALAAYEAVADSETEGDGDERQDRG